jgi:hypothetical protein
MHGAVCRSHVAAFFTNMTLVPYHTLECSRMSTRMSITSGDKVFYYMTRDSLCFLTMAEARYPKRLAFLYLDEIGDMLLAELVREFGNNVSTRTREKDKTPRHCQGQTTATFRKNNGVRLRLTHILPFKTTISGAPK